MGSEEGRIGCLGKVRDAGQVGGNESEGWRPPCEPDRTQTIGQSQRCAGGCLAARGARHGARARAFHSSGSRARMHACTRSRPEFGAPPTHVPSMGPEREARGGTWGGGGAVVSTCMQSPGRHMGWWRRCDEHLHAEPITANHESPSGQSRGQSPWWAARRA